MEVHRFFNGRKGDARCYIEEDQKGDNVIFYNKYCSELKKIRLFFDDWRFTELLRMTKLREEQKLDKKRVPSSNDVKKIIESQKKKRDELMKIESILVDIFILDVHRSSLIDLVLEYIGMSITYIQYFIEALEFYSYLKYNQEVRQRDKRRRYNDNKRKKRQELEEAKKHVTFTLEDWAEN